MRLLPRTWLDLRRRRQRMRRQGTLRRVSRIAAGGPLMPRHARVLADPVDVSRNEAYDQGRRDMAREVIVAASYWATTYPHTKEPSNAVVRDELWAFVMRLKAAHPNAI